MKRTKKVIQRTWKTAIKSDMDQRLSDLKRGGKSDMQERLSDLKKGRRRR